MCLHGQIIKVAWHWALRKCTSYGKKVVFALEYENI